ncbi:MAG TPA: secondary thiamine-phosphate synthase enzyme YjbQ [Thermoplasmata archaeon]
MATYSETFELETRGEVQAIDITERVAGVIARSKLGAGIVCVFSPSSTSAIVANESGAGVDEDLAALLERVAPRRASYRHEEKWHDGNGHSHVRASLLGQGFTFPFHGGKPLLGTWQQLWFLELDNKARTREVRVTLVG